jgi:aryl-alcohol dehydrogenase-like predicted oxidoreductase
MGYAQRGCILLCFCCRSPDPSRVLAVAAPIVGMTSIKHLQDSIEAIHINLTEEEIKMLEEPYVARTIMGH